jgi:hypothetical protein
LGGIAFLIKQQAAAAFAVFFLWATFIESGIRQPFADRLRKIGFITLGAALPVLAFTAYQFLHAHTLSGFWYWTVRYHLEGRYFALAGMKPTAGQINQLASACLLLPPALLFLLEDARRSEPK